MTLSAILIQYFAVSLAFAHLYEVSIDSFETDPNTDRDFITIGSLRVSRKDRNNFILTGNVITHQNIGNENVCIAEIRGKNGKGPVLISTTQHFCDMYNSDFELIKSAIDAFEMPPQGTCPLPKGNYTMKEFELREKDLPVVAIKDQYDISVKLMNPEGHLLLGYKIKLTVS